MKIHSKIGNRPGRPAYRTPSSFKYRKSLKVERGRMSAKGSCLPVGRDLSQRLPVRPMKEPASPASPIPPAPQNAVAEAGGAGWLAQQSLPEKNNFLLHEISLQVVIRRPVFIPPDGHSDNFF